MQAKLISSYIIVPFLSVVISLSLRGQPADPSLTQVAHTIDALKTKIDVDGPFTPELYTKLVRRLRVLDFTNPSDADFLSNASDFASDKVKPQLFIPYLEKELARPPTNSPNVAVNTSPQGSQSPTESPEETYKKALILQCDGQTPTHLADSRKMLEDLAAAGNLHAIERLFDMHISGYGGVTQSAEGAFQFAQIAAKAGDPFAMLCLAGAYGDGGVIPADSKLANDWSKKAFDAACAGAAHGDGHCMFALSLCYVGGVGTSQDGKQYLEWVKKGADADNPDCLYLYATSLLNMPGLDGITNLQEGNKKMNRAADLLKVDAMLQMGNISQTLLDSDAAMKWYRKAANAGCPKAMFQIGEAYRSWDGAKLESQNPGRGGEGRQWAENLKANAHEALKWYQMAADLGDLQSMYWAGYDYANGVGVAVDGPAAVKYYQKAAELGDTASMAELGKCYFSGFGVDRDNDTALKWLKKAADAGNLDAKAFLQNRVH